VFTFFSSGFDNQVTVVFWAHDPTGHVYGNDQYRTFTTGEGRADWQWAAPGDAIPGTWTMVARQLNNASRTFTIPFEITPLEGSDPQPPSQVDSPQSNSRNVEPDAGPPGTRFNFFATGFERKEHVGYWFNTPAGTVLSNDARYQVQASETGRVDWWWDAPLDAVPGTWQVVAKGKDTEIERSVFFEITPSPGGEPDPSSGAADFGVDPDVGGVRTTFAFFSLGFAPEETVSFWAIAPDGEEIGKDSYTITANEEGRADWFWRPPDANNTDEGKWQMIAFGQSSQYTRVIPFEIQFGLD
jgi:hypothetical protein